MYDWTERQNADRLHEELSSGWLIGLGEYTEKFFAYAWWLPPPMNGWLTAPSLNVLMKMIVSAEEWYRRNYPPPT